MSPRSIAAPAPTTTPARVAMPVSDELTTTSSVAAPSVSIEKRPSAAVVYVPAAASSSTTSTCAPATGCPLASTARPVMRPRSNTITMSVV